MSLVLLTGCAYLLCNLLIIRLVAIGGGTDHRPTEIELVALLLLGLPMMISQLFVFVLVRGISRNMSRLNGG